jgi:hypothetical protein
VLVSVVVVGVVVVFVTVVVPPLVTVLVLDPAEELVELLVMDTGGVAFDPGPDRATARAVPPPVTGIEIAQGGVEVVPARASPLSAAQPFLDPDRLAQLLGGAGRIARDEVEGAELVEHPGLAGQISQGARGDQRDPERADEVEPAEQQREQCREIARQAKRLLAPACPVEPSDERRARRPLPRPPSDRARAPGRSRRTGAGISRSAT